MLNSFNVNINSVMGLLRLTFAWTRKPWTREQVVSRNANLVHATYPHVCETL